MRIPVCQFLLAAILLVSFSGLRVAVIAGEPRVRASDMTGEIVAVKITKIKKDDSSPGCSDFVLDSDQVRFFFLNSVVISDFEKRELYPYYPCWVEGGVVASKGKFRWQISAGGSGGFWPENSKKSIVYFACGMECKEFFLEVGPDGAMAAGE